MYSINIIDYIRYPNYINKIVCFYFACLCFRELVFLFLFENYKVAFVTVGSCFGFCEFLRVFDEFRCFV